MTFDIDISEAVLCSDLEKTEIRVKLPSHLKLNSAKQFPGGKDNPALCSFKKNHKHYLLERIK